MNFQCLKFEEEKENTAKTSLTDRKRRRHGKETSITPWEGDERKTRIRGGVAEGIVS
jgi:hypothetical protein